MGEDFCGRKNDGAETFFQERNDGAGTFFERKAHFFHLLVIVKFMEGEEGYFLVQKSLPPSFFHPKWSSSCLFSFGLSGTRISFQSIKYPDRYVRHKKFQTLPSKKRQLIFV